MSQDFPDILLTDLISDSRVKILNRDEAVRTGFLGAAEPSVMAAGQDWIDTTATLMKVRNAANTAWYTKGDFATELGHLPLTGGILTNFLTLHANPTNVLHAVTKQYSDLKLPLTGGSLSNFLSLHADPTAALHAATKQYVDGLTGKVSKMIDETWTGDDANNRVIDLGDDYDFILIFAEAYQSANQVCMAYAFKTTYGVFYSSTVSFRLGTESNIYWQGKGISWAGNVNYIKLGSTGNSSFGLNYNTWVYRLIGFKFSAMV